MGITANPCKQTQNRMSNCPICEIELDAKDISVLENHIVAKHSDVAGIAKTLATILPRKIEDLDHKLQQQAEDVIHRIHKPRSISI